MDFSRAAEETLYSEQGSMIEKIQKILNQGREMTAIDPSLSQPLKGLETTLIQLEEIALVMRDYSGRVEMNPMRLDEIENRLEEIDRLKRKYGSTVKEVLSFKHRTDEALRSSGLTKKGFPIWKVVWSPSGKE